MIRSTKLQFKSIDFTTLCILFSTGANFPKRKHYFKKDKEKTYYLKFFKKCQLYLQNIKLNYQIFVRISDTDI